MATMNMHERHFGKVALITGGSSGIGLATARRLAAEGAHVVITGRRRETLDEASHIIGRDHATAICGDVSAPSDLSRVFATIAADLGVLDIVFANAGLGSILPLGDITEAQFDRTFGTNVKGVVFTVQGALRLLRPGASIILNASTAASKGTFGFSIYSATKAAVRSLARSWILDLRGRDVRINVLSPGVVPTPGYDGLGLQAEELQAFIDGQATTIPLGRVGTPDEIAAVVSFLASAESSFINGAEIFADGGMAQI